MIVTIQPPTHVRRNLRVDNGLFVDTLHITLCYIDKEYDKDQKVVMNVAAALIETCNAFSEIPCEINKLGRFEKVAKMTDNAGNTMDATEPTDVIYAEVEGSALYEMRQYLVDALDKYDVPYSKMHKNFKGHISLIYVPHGETLKEEPSLPQTFNATQLEIWGKGEEVLFNYKFKGT